MKCFLLLNFIALSLCSVAQNKIMGIGKYKIGQATTSVITQLSTETKVKVKLAFKNPDVFAGMGVKNRKTSNIFLLSRPSVIKDSTKKQSDWYIDLPDVKIYFVDYLEVARVPVLRTFFYFYQDTLYKIYSNEVDSQFIEAVRLKYGEGNSYNSTTNFNCKENGVNKKLVGDKTLVTWTNNNIKATYYSSEMFDTFCKPFYFTYFIVTNEKTEEIVKQKVEEVTRKKKEDESNSRIKSLEDF